MIYLRSLVVGILACLIWVLSLYAMTDGMMVALAHGMVQEALLALAIAFEATVLGYWATEIPIHENEKTGKLETVGMDATFMRLLTALVALGIFSLTYAYIYGSWAVALNVFQSSSGFMLALATFLACQIVHYFGPDYMLKRRA